jgi:hypothetical protein
MHSYNKTNEIHFFPKFIFGIELYMFWTVSLSIIRSLVLYIQHNLYDIYLLLCVHCWTPDDGQRNCPKHVNFYCRNKFEKLVHLVGFIIKIYRDARSSECQNPSMYFVEITYENSSDLLNAARSSRTSLRRNITATPLNTAQTLISKPSAQLLVLLCDSCPEQSCTAARFLSLFHFPTFPLSHCSHPTPPDHSETR